MPAMTLQEFLATPEDYRTVSHETHRLKILRLVDGVTTLEPVTITDKLAATWSRTTPDGFYVARAEVRALGEQAPSFSLTGEHWKSERHYREGWERSGLYGLGAMGDTLAELWPHLAPLNALHLANAIDGRPMYAQENGWYHYTQGDHDAAARALRVDPSDLPRDMDEDGFRVFHNAQVPRWAREAAEGRAIIQATQA